jgi:hypothetical protein
MASRDKIDTPISQYAKEARLDVSSPKRFIDETDLSTIESSKPNGLWIRFMTFLHWYPKDMPHEEKSLTLKLDLSILIFGCLSFFTKYLDQQSITNAYVR